MQEAEVAGAEAATLSHQAEAALRSAQLVRYSLRPHASHILRVCLGSAQELADVGVNRCDRAAEVCTDNSHCAPLDEAARFSVPAQQLRLPEQVCYGG